MLIDVAAKYGQHCITAEDGEQLNLEVCRELDAGRDVDLDFTRALVCASPFFNAMLGTLLRDFTPEQLNAKMRFRGLSGEATELLRRVIKNSREYFADPRVREKLDALNADQSDRHQA
jgi:hypothetical protein